MEMKKKKEVTLFWMFLKRVLLMAAAIGAVFVVDILMVNIGINTGFILPANYTENYLKQNADRIIVMYDGCISAVGTHEQLLESSPIYLEVYEAQTKGDGDFDEKGGM